MSIRIVNRVLAHGPDEPHLQLLMLVLASHANDHGQAWPTLSRLARMCRVDQRTTIRSVGQLEKQGWVVVTRTHAHANRYQIDLDRLQGGDAHVRGDAHVTPRPDEVTPTSPTPDAHVTLWGDAHVTRIVRTVNEPPRSGVSPPPVDGRRPTLTPEQTHHRAAQVRRQLRTRPPPPEEPMTPDEPPLDDLHRILLNQILESDTNTGGDIVGNDHPEPIPDQGTTS